MDIAIDKICTARLCHDCYNDMKNEWVLREYNQHNVTNCDRCGRKTVTDFYRYTLGYKGYKKRGLL